MHNTFGLTNFRKWPHILLTYDFLFIKIGHRSSSLAILKLKDDDRRWWRQQCEWRKKRRRRRRTINRTNPNRLTHFTFLIEYDVHVKPIILAHTSHRCLHKTNSDSFANDYKIHFSLCVLDLRYNFPRSSLIIFLLVFVLCPPIKDIRNEMEGVSKIHLTPQPYTI